MFDLVFVFPSPFCPVSPSAVRAFAYSLVPPALSLVAFSQHRTPFGPRWIETVCCCIAAILQPLSRANPRNRLLRFSLVLTCSRTAHSATKKRSSALSFALLLYRTFSRIKSEICPLENLSCNSCSLQPAFQRSFPSHLRPISPRTPLDSHSSCPGPKHPPPSNNIYLPPRQPHHPSATVVSRTSIHL